MGLEATTIGKCFTSLFEYVSITACSRDLVKIVATKNFFVDKPLRSHQLDSKVSSMMSRIKSTFYSVQNFVPPPLDVVTR